MSALITLSRHTGVRAQFSHIALIEPDTWGRADEACALFDYAVAAGTDVAFDVYPYDASSSNLTQYLPAWVQAGGLDAMRQRLADRSGFAQAEKAVAAGWYGGIPWDWEGVSVSRIPAHDNGLVGRTLAELADDRRCQPAQLVLDLCLEFGNEIQVVLSSRREDDMIVFLSHPLGTLGSDGSALPLDAGASVPHPRNYGAQARLLGRYVRDQQLLPIEAAVWKMTGAVAQRLRLDRRGLLQPGCFADVVVFDPNRIADHATFTRAAPASGIHDVFVNGVPVVTDGQQTQERGGLMLRAEAA